MNYGETLAYWYLRLNGFFPLRNFVLHSRDNREDRSDCDLLAIRHPWVEEDIGGQPDDWDGPIFSERLQLSLDRTLVLVVQVKTGPAADHGSAFVPARMKAATKRVGLWPRDDAEAIAEALDGQATWFGENDGPQIAKLLIASTPCNHAAVHLSIAMSEAVAFIRRRLANYRNIKAADRFFFPDELIQFLASADSDP